MGSLLEIQNLCISFGPFKAVDGVGLTLKEGEFFALVGESGSGKTLTALSVTRLLPSAATLESGKVLFQGEDLLSLGEGALRAFRGGKISYVFQEPSTSLNPVLTIGDQIMEVILLHGRDDQKEARREAIVLLEKVGIPSTPTILEAYPHQLSGGMKQRAMIAMALVSHPTLLIADEPTTALDVTIQAQILELLLEMKRELSLTIFFITHDLGLVSAIADHVAVMQKGKIVEEGECAQIFSRPKHPYTEMLLQCMEFKTLS
ncbi:MAG: ABC transporter ATP-binding protein [Candidatus Omnitrophica bacterium]|nr:ABC transporter ATP-binding protein [Candidatus Omnitrophota bacterium]